MPLGTLQGLVVQFCPKHSIGFHVTHDGVDGALVALGVQSKRLDQFTAGAGSVVDESRADLGADDGSEHCSVVVNELIITRILPGSDRLLYFLMMPVLQYHPTLLQGSDRTPQSRCRLPQRCSCWDLRAYWISVPVPDHTIVSLCHLVIFLHFLVFKLPTLPFTLETVKVCVLLTHDVLAELIEGRV